MVGGSDCRMVVYLMMPCFFSYTGHSYKKPSYLTVERFFCRELKRSMMLQYEVYSLRRFIKLRIRFALTNKPGHSRIKKLFMRNKDTHFYRDMQDTRKIRPTSRRQDVLQSAI